MLSIVVPILDEATTIATQLARLQPLRARGAEVIVVDGGSADDSAELAAPFADRVIVAPRGRARQMNAGAAAASGDTLLFLHADTRLPPDADALVAASLAAGARWGRFDVRIDGRHRLLPVVAWLMNRRSRLTGIATGDQAMFVERATFVAVGGFPDQPLMEDIALSARLRRHSRPACLAERVLTSGRRWEQQGFWRTVLLMWRLRYAYWRGTDASELARRYGYREVPSGPRPSRRPTSTLAGAPKRIAMLVFAKAPVPGLAKTRLIPSLGVDGAAELASRLIERCLCTAAGAHFASLQLWCTPDTDHPALISAASRHGATLHLQRGRDLGERMQNALAEALATHHAALLIGTDCPDLELADLHEAARSLQGPRDVSLIPADDGGYVLVGMRRPNPALFSGVAWGSGQVLEQTKARAAAAGLRICLGRKLRDIDRPEDLTELALELAPRP